MLRGINLSYESQQSRCSPTADYPGCFSITGNLVVGISRSPIRFLETPPMSRETHAGGSRRWLAAVQTVGLHTPSICRLAQTRAPPTIARRRPLVSYKVKSLVERRRLHTICVRLSSRSNPTYECCQRSFTWLQVQQRLCRLYLSSQNVEPTWLLFFACI